MLTKTTIAAAAAVAAFIAPLYCAAAPVQAKSRPHWTGAAMFGAYAAATKSRRATRSAPRGRISQATEPPIHVIGPNGRDLGTDPDAAIRFQLRRDSTMGMGSM
jgi:hypothetical protein